MKRKILYPKVIVTGQDYKGIKSVTVPDQSMSLHEIIKRFTRKESLPIEKEGYYDTRFGDLEKLKHADLTEQTEKIEEIKTAVKRHNKRVSDEAERKKALTQTDNAQPLETS